MPRPRGSQSLFLLSFSKQPRISRMAFKIRRRSQFRAVHVIESQIIFPIIARELLRTLEKKMFTAREKHRERWRRIVIEKTTISAVWSSFAHRRQMCVYTRETPVYSVHKSLECHYHGWHYARYARDSGVCQSAGNAIRVGRTWKERWCGWWGWWNCGVWIMSPVSGSSHLDDFATSVLLDAVMAAPPSALAESSAMSSFFFFFTSGFVS